jgi:signal transduction histidine kinase
MSRLSSADEAAPRSGPYSPPRCRMLRVTGSSLRTRTVSATSAVMALVSIAVSMLFLVAVGDQETDAARARIIDGWDRVLPLIALGHDLPPVLPDSMLADSKNEAIQVMDASGRVVAATRQLAGKPPIATLGSTDNNVHTSRTLCPPPGLKGCRIVVSFKVFQPDGIWLLNLTVPEVPWYGSTFMVGLVLAVSALMITMMAAGVSRAVGRSLAPVEAIRAELSEITATDLHRRVPVPANWDEIRLLAETVNATLDRLDGAYERLRRFTSDASHDLRNPISAMRVQVEEGLMHPCDTDWPRTATKVLAEINRLQAIVTDLLALAWLDARAPLTRAPTDLTRLIGTELDRRTYRVEIVKDLCGTALVNCDPLRIIRLFTNLIHNAERHANSRIIVMARADGPEAVLEVIDDGEGIAAEHREMVFERFVRLEASLRRDAGGTGLGLAIARGIAEAHGGTLTVEDNAQGACFVLRLPRCDL